MQYIMCIYVHLHCDVYKHTTLDRWIYPSFMSSSVVGFLLGVENTCLLQILGLLVNNEWSWHNAMGMVISNVKVKRGSTPFEHTLKL